MHDVNHRMRQYTFILDDQLMGKLNELIQVLVHVEELGGHVVDLVLIRVLSLHVDDFRQSFQKKRFFQKIILSFPRTCLFFARFENDMSELRDLWMFSKQTKELRRHLWKNTDQ